MTALAITGDRQGVHQHLRVEREGPWKLRKQKMNKNYSSTCGRTRNLSHYPAMPFLDIEPKESTAILPDPWSLMLSL